MDAADKLCKLVEWTRQCHIRKPKNCILTLSKKNKKNANFEDITLFQRGTESAMHLTPDGDELDHPMILPVADILLEVDIVFAIV